MKWIKKLEKADQEEEFATDESKAVIEFDGNHDVPHPGKAFPFSFIMISVVIGEVPVKVCQDMVMVDGVAYSNKEIKDLKNRGLSGTDMRAVHKIKKQFSSSGGLGQRQ